jgi:hypothetical protein
MYPNAISRALCWAGIIAGGSRTDVLPTVTRDANSSAVRGLDSDAISDLPSYVWSVVKFAQIAPLRPPQIPLALGSLLDRPSRPCALIHAMQDMLEHLEKFRSDAAKCALISKLATNQEKKELFARLAEHLTALASKSVRSQRATAHKGPGQSVGGLSHCARNPSRDLALDHGAAS